MYQCLYVMSSALTCTLSALLMFFVYFYIYGRSLQGLGAWVEAWRLSVRLAPACG